MVSAVGAQSTTRCPSPRLGVGLDVAEARTPRRGRAHGQLLGLDGVDPGPVEDLDQVRLDLVPGLLHAACASSCWPTARARRGAPTSTPSCPSGASKRRRRECAGSVLTARRVRRPRRRRNGGAPVAAPPLCRAVPCRTAAPGWLGVTATTGGASTAGGVAPRPDLFSSDRAVLMMRASARRFTKPGMGTIQVDRDELVDDVGGSRAGPALQPVGAVELALEVAAEQVPGQPSGAPS